MVELFLPPSFLCKISPKFLAVTVTEHSAPSDRPGDGPADGQALARRDKVVLVMDLVESVRLMALDEKGVIEHIHRMLVTTRDDIAPRHRGRLVKSLGDGILCEFDDARGAIAATQELHRIFDDVNRVLAPERRLYLRAGLNGAAVYVDAADIFGTGVNLAQRYCTLAGAGETVAGPSVCDSLVDGLDVLIEDLGPCHLKHVEAPVRAFRLGPPGHAVDAAIALTQSESLRATVAVVPLKCTAGGREAADIGELIADGVIHLLGRTGAIKVLSRLSTSPFRSTTQGLSAIRDHLGAAYVVSGSYAVFSDSIILQVELAQADSGEVIWSERLRTSLQDLFQLDSDALQRVANGVHRQVLQSEAGRCLVAPVPSLPSYSMFLAGVQMMHRQSPGEFSRALKLLESLCERHPRIGTPYAWVANWYLLCAAQGWSSRPAEDLSRAQSAVDRALSHEPSHSLALTMRGLISGYVRRDYDKALVDYMAAIEHNPSEPLAWLYRGTLAAWTGKGDEAIEFVGTAMELSPMDPMRYYFESLAAVAHIAGQRYESAIALANQSLRRNRAHASTHKALALALSLSGRHEEARSAAQELLSIDAGFSVAQFLQKSPLAGSPDRQLFAEAYRAAGIPRH